MNRRRIDIGHHQCQSVVSAWLHGCEDVGEGEEIIAKPLRTLPALPEDIRDTDFLSDACLVLEKQTKAFAFMMSTDGFQKRRRLF